jgi:hypothetical protein
MLSPPRIRETDLVIVRGAPRQVSLRGPSKPARLVESKPLPPRQSLRFEGMSAALLALLLLLIWSFWQWQKASTAAETAKRDVEISWAFADKVLDDLQDLRADAARERLDLERTIAQQERRAAYCTVAAHRAALERRHAALPMVSEHYRTFVRGELERRRRGRGHRVAPMKWAGRRGRARQ